MLGAGQNFFQNEKLYILPKPGILSLVPCAQKKRAIVSEGPLMIYQLRLFGFHDRTALNSSVGRYAVHEHCVQIP